MKTSACTPECWTMPECAVCGYRKKPRGRSAPMEMGPYLCGPDCRGYDEDPRAGHLWPDEGDDE